MIPLLIGATEFAVVIGWCLFFHRRGLQARLQIRLPVRAKRFGEVVRPARGGSRGDAEADLERGATVAVSKDAFEGAYAERSGVSVQRLREWRRVYPCHCGEEGCEGWQSANPLLYWDDRMFRESNPLKRFGMWLALNFWRVRMWRMMREFIRKSGEN